MNKKAFILIFSCLSSVNCSISPIAPTIEEVDVPLVNGKPALVSKNPRTNFINQLKAENIVLSKEDGNLIKAYQLSRPGSQWNTSETGSLLEKHYNEFKKSFVPNGPTSQFEYLNKAIQFANSTNFYAKYYFDVNYYKSRNKILVIRWDTQTKEFIIIYTDGKLSNYQIAENIGLPRYILIPDDL